MKQQNNNLTALDALAWLGSALGTAVIAMLAAVLMAGCSPRTVPYPVETVRYERMEADTARFMALINSLKDEIKSRERTTDSVVRERTRELTVDQNGDTTKEKETVYVYISHQQEKDYERTIKSCRDSISQLARRLASVKTDSVPVPYPVERELTRWEKTKMDFGGIAIGGLCAAVLAAVIVWIVKRKRRR